MTKEARICNGEKTVYSINGAVGKLEKIETVETRTFFNIIYKNKLKMD